MSRAWKWYRVPITILTISLMSIMLFYALHRIRVYQHVNSVISNAILHVELNAALFHLSVEEFVGGETSVDVKGATASIDKAIKLADMIRTGKDTEPGLNLELMRRLGLQSRAEELKSLLERFKTTGLARLADRERTGPGSYADQRFDSSFGEILRKATAMEDICKTNVEEFLQRSRWMVTAIYLIWALIVITATVGLWRIEMRRKAADESLLEANSRLISQAEELTLHRENLEGLVNKRTAELSAANEHLRLEIAERLLAEETLKESENQIRRLSSQLLRAQEIERRRISMELHDGLGQALNVMKLRLRFIEMGLGEGQEAAKQDCEGLRGYLDDVIEDVRRISRDLSPAILEDLGLSSALRWLVGSFSRMQTVEVTCDIAEIDDLFPENDRVTIYRVVQEALANVGKHSQAGKVSVIIRRLDGRVSFAVEDNGTGFDPIKVDTKEGMGLTTMSERVRMMGGVFELRSSEGEGTRIDFIIPVVNVEA